MTPQLTKIAECLSESHAREIKLARCLAESLKRIQSLESASKTKDTKAKAAEVRFNAAMRKLSEHYAKITDETSTTAAETIRRITELEATFPAQIAALKAEFATPAAQAAAPQSFNPRGAYEPGEKYKPFDYVSSNGSSYIALVENPTQPPSKKSKQWMLVAARGAGGGDSGGGGDTSGLLVKSANLSDLTNTTTARTNLGLGTAATRNVGQAAGNVLELSALGIVSLVGLEIYDTGNEGYASIRLENDNWTLGTTTSAGISFGTSPDYNLFINGTNISGNRQLDVPDASGTIALLSQVGDRYLTSSTTSNTIGNGAKTFIIGTGLAYTPTQDVTIVFNASNHMHASVTSYNSATGSLVVDVNSHTGSGTYAVWTVNVGGIGAGAIPSGGTAGQVLAKVSSNNYDDDWVTPTVAVGGVTGLGTGVATALAINVGTAGAPVVNGGALGTPVSGTLTNCTGLPIGTGITGFGTGVAAALAVNVGTAGAPVVNGGALGTPSSGTVTNLTGTASININGTVGATTPTTGAFTTLTSSSTTDAANNSTAGAVSISGGLAVAKSATIGPASGVQLRFGIPGRNNWFTTWTAQTGTALALQLHDGLQLVRASNLSSTLLDVFDNTTGNATTPYLRVRNSNGDFFQVGALGDISQTKTITAAGTTGAQTINKSSGAVNFAAAATSLVVTNSFCTVNSVIQCTVGTNDTTLKSVAVVAAAGSFTMHANAAATAETRVFFSITN